MDLSYYSDTGAFDPIAAAQPGYDPYSDVGWFGSGVFKKIGNAAKSIGKAAAKVGKVVSPIVSKAMPYVQTALKNMGPIGMAASGAVSGMGAVLQGKNIKDVAIAAAIGAAPTGIDRALQVGLRIAKGDNLIKIGMDQAQKEFIPGSEGEVAFGIAKKLLSKGSPKQALAAARANLANEAQRRSFDAAVGTAARLGDKMKMPRVSAKMQDAIRRQNIIAGNRGPRPINTLPPPQRRNKVAIMSAPVKLALSKIHTTGGDPMAIARTYGAPLGAVRRMMGTRVAPRTNWAPLSESASSFVLRHASHAPMGALRAFGRDTGALVEDGKVYVVEPGDFPSKIAKKLTGDGNRFRELHTANPNKKIATSGQFKGSFATLFAGERLIVPESWRPKPAPGPIVTTLPEVVVTPAGPVSVPTPVAAPAGNVPLAAILQAKSLLVTWSKTDGLNEAGPTDYGVRPEDMSTTFGPRDRLVAMAFESWSNRNRDTKLLADGEMNGELSGALRAWAEARSSLPVPAVPSAPVTPPVVVRPAEPAPSAPTPPVVSPFPTVPPVVAQPSSPTPAPVVPFPALPALPAGLPASPSLPTLPATPAAPGGAVASSDASSDGGDILLPLGAGVAGALLFNPLVGLVTAGLGIVAMQKSA